MHCWAQGMRTPSCLCAKVLAVDACNHFYNLLFHRQRELGCILKKLAAIEPLQVEFIRMDSAALLAAQIDPVQ